MSSRKIIALTLCSTLCSVVLLPAISFGGELSGHVAVKSDYRHRGVSKTDNGFAVQGSLDWFTDSGLYAGLWASNIDDFKGADIETNFYVGMNKEIDGIIYDFGATAYVYPGGDNATYFEPYATVGIDYGIFTSSVGLAYIFSTDNIGGEDNFYLYNDTRGTIPNTPFSLNLHLGYEDGAFGNKKWDWKLGTSITFDQFEVGVAYIDTNIDTKRSSGGLIFSVEAFF